MKIYKYPIQIAGPQELKMPRGMTPLHVGLDPIGVPCIWAKVEPESEIHGYTVWVCGTGHDAPEDFLHIGTFIQGPFVWHVFMKT